MSDTRFQTPGVDARFPSPGTDIRFPSPGTDDRFQSGVDTRFEGSTYGSVAGPTVTTPPSVTPLTAQDGVEVTRTQGVYAASGGGSVSITTSEWRIDDAQVSTGASYTPGAGQVGGVLTYYEIATETGGSSPGTTIRQVQVGIVQPAASGSGGFSSGFSSGFN